MPRLEWSELPDQPQSFPLDGVEVVIGRRVDSQIILTHPLVSRRHATLVRESSSFVISDLQSSHGTWVNGERIERRTLRPRDRICLGEFGLELTYLESLPGEGSGGGGSSLLEGMGLDHTVMRLAAVLPDESASIHSEIEKVSFLLDFHYSFGKAFSADRTFQHVLKSALSISGAERGFILRKEQGEFVFAVGLDSKGSTLGQSDFRTSGSVVDRAARGGEAVFMTQGIHGDLAASESIVAMNLRAVACMPLEAISPDTGAPAVMGILYLDSRKHMHALSGLDEKVLTRLAVEAGNVIEKLDMVVTLAEKNRMEQELAIAEETQRSLLPRSLPQFEPFRIGAFSRPTRQLGGDFYDFISVRSGLLTGVLADVSGKGIPAALLSSFTLGALNMEFRSTAQPEIVLAGVNKVLCDKTPAHRFVTLFLFQLDAGGNGHYISAGHNPAYLFRSASGEVEELPSGGMPMGMFPFAAYEPVPLRLNRGDVLLVYSDGLSEAENRAQEEFGEDRLLALFRTQSPGGADALQAALLDELDKFTQGAMQSDDITFIVVENRGD